ncbi:MAG: hypothetical protein ACYDC1_18800 [Limisphaerales bacterium]
MIAESMRFKQKLWNEVPEPPLLLLSRKPTAEVSQMGNLFVYARLDRLVDLNGDRWKREILGNDIIGLRVLLLLLLIGRPDPAAFEEPENSSGVEQNQFN